MTNDELRAEFRHVDMIYIGNHHPKAYEHARRYNVARACIDPAVPGTIKIARRALDKLMQSIGS